MDIPHISIDSKSSDPEYEVQRLEKILHMGKDDYHFEGLVHGGILSEFQKKRFQLVCSKLNLKLISPIWKENQKQYMKTLIECKFRFIITSVTTEGLDESWLGREITAENLPELETLSEKYGFNLNFEGGEAETFVIDCPLFSHPIKIEKFRTEWDGYRGRFEILDAKLDYNAR